MSEKQRKPWYLNNPELFMIMLLLGCFLVGGSIAYTISSLFVPMQHKRESWHLPHPA